MLFFRSVGTLSPFHGPRLLQLSLSLSLLHMMRQEFATSSARLVRSDKVGLSRQRTVFGLDTGSQNATVLPIILLPYFEDFVLVVKKRYCLSTFDASLPTPHRVSSMQELRKIVFRGTPGNFKHYPKTRVRRAASPPLTIRVAIGAILRHHYDDG